MASAAHMPVPEDDRRHVPGEGSLPLWNESFWFPFYDPASEIGVVLRAGIYANQKTANLFLFITHRGRVVHSLVDHGYPVPPLEPNRMTIGSLAIEWGKPLESFHLRYSHAPHGFDFVWEGLSPAYLYPAPPGTTADQAPRHIEHAGTVKGTVTIAGKPHPVDCLAHRDHSFGGERDWAKFYKWNYLSGEIDRRFWFNAVRIAFAPEMDYIHIGCLWDGKELLDLEAIEMNVKTADAGARQLGVDLRLIDEKGRRHEIVGEEILVNCVVPFGRTWLKDGITRYRYEGRVGHGILEHGYVEQG